MGDKFVCVEGVHLQIMPVHQNKRVSGGEGSTLIAIDEWIDCWLTIPAAPQPPQMVHCSIQSESEECGLDQALIADSLSTAVFLDLPALKFKQFGDRQKEGDATHLPGPQM